MGYLIPKQELTVEEVMEIESALVEKLFEIAMAQTGLTREELTSRELLPKTDLGWTNEEFKITFAAAYTEEEEVRITLPKNKFIGLYAVTNEDADPATLYISFGTPAKVADIWHLSKIYTYENPTGFAKEPVIFIGGKTMVWKFYGKRTGDDYPVVRGIVVEPIGEKITPAIGRK